MAVSTLDRPAKQPVVRSILLVSATKRKTDGVDPFELLTTIGEALGRAVTPIQSQPDDRKGVSIQLWDGERGVLFRYFGDGKWVLCVHDHNDERERWKDLWRATQLLSPWTGLILGQWHIKMDYGTSDIEIDEQVLNMDWFSDGDLLQAVTKACPKNCQV